MTQIVLTIPEPPTHCPLCGAEYVHHQAPGKPAGVSGSASCNCVLEFDTSVPWITRATLRSPKASAP